MENIGNWITEQIRAFLEMLFQLIADLATPYAYWNEPWAVNSRNVLVTIAWSLLALRVAYEAWRLYIARDAGEHMTPPSTLLRRIATAALAIPATGWGLRFVVQLTSEITRAVTSVAGAPNWTEFFNAVIEYGLVALVPGVGLGVLLVPAFVLLVIAGCSLAVFIQAYMRGVELAVALIVGPICALSAATSDDPISSGALGVWLREVLVLTAAGVFQALLLAAFVAYTVGTGFEVLHLLLGCPLLFVAFSVPKLLRLYVHGAAGGSAGGAGGAAMTALLTKYAIW